MVGEIEMIDPITKEEHELNLQIVAEQLRIIKRQEQDKIPLIYTKIRCVCERFVLWQHMYRCLYCGIWFCKDCAEEHYGMTVEEYRKEHPIEDCKNAIT